MTRLCRTSDRLSAFSASTRVRPGRRIEHGRQPVALGQLAGLGGDAAGDPLELVAAGQVVLDDDELPLQLDGDLHHGRQDDDEGPTGLAGGDRRVEGLDDLDVVQEPVESCAARAATVPSGLAIAPSERIAGQRVAGTDGRAGIRRTGR